MVVLSVAKACPERSRRDLIAASNRHEILRFAQDDNSAHLRPATSVSATKAFPGVPRPPAIAKAIAEIAGIAEIASSGNSGSLSSAQGPGRAVVQLGQHLVGMPAVPEAASNQIFSAHR
jgi:hypothetical protein